MSPIKIEQVAIYAPNPNLLIENLSQSLGLTEWVHDTVIAQGDVFGREAMNKAKLSFNYQLGYEFELITYHNPSGQDWHSAQGRALNGFPFLSHKGYHVEDMEAEKKKYTDLGWVIAQEVKTISHTNPYLIEKKRRYHYVVFDSRKIIGFDLKLIKRIEGAE